MRKRIAKKIIKNYRRCKYNNNQVMAAVRKTKTVPAGAVFGKSKPKYVGKFSVEEDSRKMEMPQQNRSKFFTGEVTILEWQGATR